MSSFGQLRSFNLVMDTSSGMSKGFAFCEFLDPLVTDTVSALSLLLKGLCNSLWISVSELRLQLSLAILNYTVLPSTWHKWIQPTLIPARQAITQFTYCGRMEGWVDLGGWLCNKMVYLCVIQVVAGPGVEANGLTTNTTCCCCCCMEYRRKCLYDKADDLKRWGLPTSSCSLERYLWCLWIHQNYAGILDISSPVPQCGQIGDISGQWKCGWWPWSVF